MECPTILLVIEGTYPWYRGGVSEWVHQYISHFKEVEFHILQVATDQYLNTSIDHALYNVPDHVKTFVRIPPPDLSREWKNVSDSWFENVRGDIGMYRRSVDLVHIANTGFAGWLGMKIAGALSKPLILTEHALYWKEVSMGAVALECGYKIPDRETEKERMADMFQSLAAQIYRKSDEVVSVSRCNMASQADHGAVSPRYIPNGVEQSWLEATGKASSRLTIGWIGRCAEMKNPLGFFDFAEAIKNTGLKDYRFIMMACDANEKELQMRVEDRLAEYPEIEYLWNEPSEKHIHKMDALCITSHNESQPLVLFEALAKKVLPVGWQAGDVTEEYGLIVSRDTSAERLARMVATLWKQSGQWKEKVNLLHEKVTDSHTWSSIFDRYRQLFVSHLHPR